MFCTISLENVLLATAACNFSTSDLQKVVTDPLNIFTCKCASRHSGVPFFHVRTSKKCSEHDVFCTFWLTNVLVPVFDIITSKSASNLTCFVHFHFQMCFSPLRRAIFRHHNFKNCFGAEVFCTFSLPNVLFATAACNFWFLLWPHDSAPAALTGLLFDWPDTRIIEKTQHFATSLTFGADVSSFFWLSRYCIFFLLTLLHLICFSSAFSTLHIVGSLLFKLPSINHIPSCTKLSFCFLVQKGVQVSRIYSDIETTHVSWGNSWALLRDQAWRIPVFFG